MDGPASYFDIVQWLGKDAAAAFLKSSRPRRYETGNVIYLQGEPGNQMFRIVSGSVRLSVFNADGRELLFQLFGAGDCFGNSSIIDGGPRPQTAEAFSPCELQLFNKEAVDGLRRTFSSISDALLMLTARQARLLSSYFAQSTLDQPATRVAQRLVAAADRFGLDLAAGMRLQARFSQSELAMMVGTGRQTVNKVLQDFQADGLVTVSNRDLLVLDLPRLRAIAEGNGHTPVWPRASTE